MRTAVIVDAVRTATGKRHGGLSGWDPTDLAAFTLTGLVQRAGVDPAIVDDVIMGCVTQIGRQASNIARYAALGAGFPESVPGVTIDRQCGSSQQAVHFAAQGVMAGVYDTVIAAGVEVMSSTPMMSAVSEVSPPFASSVAARYHAVESRGHRGLVPQGVAAELISDRWGLTRSDLDTYGARSQQRASRAQNEGAFDHEILPVPERRRAAETGEIHESGSLHLRDEGVRAGTTADVLAGLSPAFMPDGLTTAGTSSQIADGASAVLIMSEARASSLGLRPLASIKAMAVEGSDPVLMLTGPIPATRSVLRKAGLNIDEIDHHEVNEAFAAVVLAWQHELGVDLERVNPLGGAIALGHPLGATGTKLMATLVHALVRTSGRYGLQVMCEGGGMANATVIERIS